MSGDPKSDNVIAEFLRARMEESFKEFDRTMGYIREAVAVERERCAQLAERLPQSLFSDLDPAGDSACRAGAAIAEKIRSGE